MGGPNIHRDWDRHRSIQNVPTSAATAYSHASNGLTVHPPRPPSDSHREPHTPVRSRGTQKTRTERVPNETFRCEDDSLMRRERLAGRFRKAGWQPLPQIPAQQKARNLYHQFQISEICNRRSDCEVNRSAGLGRKHFLTTTRGRKDKRAVPFPE